MSEPIPKKEKINAPIPTTGISMSSSDSPVPNCSIKAEYSPMLSDLHEILQSTAEPDNGSNGFNVKISASDKNTGAKSNDLSAGFRPQLDEDTAVAVRVRDLERMKELDNFIASALAQFQFDEFIKRLTMAKGELQRFYTCKTQIDADQGQFLNFQDGPNILRSNIDLKSP